MSFMTSDQFKNFITHLRTLPRDEVARIRDSAPQFPQYKEAGDLVIAEIDAAQAKQDAERRHKELIEATKAASHSTAAKWYESLWVRIVALTIAVLAGLIVAYFKGCFPRVFR
jgi:hypothetical protein